ncbi:RDD family protein [Candidatus Latescibacterota bacterium]
MDDKHIKAGFWRRIAAAWIDSFVIYSIAVFLITITAKIGLRVALEPLYIVFAAVYGTALIAWRGQTIGKMLLGISVSTISDARLSLRVALVREVLGKWGITVVMPVILGRALVGQAWVPTVYNILILLPVLLLLLVHYMITKQTWYDRLAGTNVGRVTAPCGLVWPVFVTLIGVAILGFGTKAIDFKVQKWIPCRLAIYRSMHSTKPYTAFLKQGQAAPVDYIIGLFDRYDVVVLSERIHSEGSQWEFIFEVVKDPRFVKKVGNVFTEYGQVELQAFLDNFMATDGLDAREIQERVIHIMRDFPVWPVWINTNFYIYLTRLYELNQSLPVDKRIKHHFTDMSANWPDMSNAEDYREYYSSLKNRDERMAQSVIEKMFLLSESGSTSSKCLVVMNYRHGFDLIGRSPEVKRINTYEFLKDTFGNRAANVLLNARLLISVPIAGGLWDAAFEDTGNRPAGFDFEGSPFGKDPFDIFPFNPTVKGKLKYQDVFTGFVYAHPLDDQYLQEGIPGYFEGFEEEVLRRARLLSEDYPRKIEYLINREKRGHVALKRELPGREIETLLELYLLGLNGVGLLIGVVAFSLLLLRGNNERRELVAKE